MPSLYQLLIAMATVLADHSEAASPVLQCVCTTHVFAPIYRAGAWSDMPTGFLYDHECKVLRPEVTYRVPGYYAIEHYHQVLYVRMDSATYVSQCPPDIDSNDRLTTPKPATPTPTTQPRSTTSPSTHLTSTPQKPSRKTTTHTTAPSTTSKQTHPSTNKHATTVPMTPHQNSMVTQNVAGLASSTPVPPQQATIPVQAHCNKLMLFSDIALHVNIGSGASTLCADQMRHSSDAILNVFCGAPPSIRWKPGENVAERCASIPAYTPIAVFDTSRQYLSSAGVFLGCTANGFHVVTQDCSSKVHIEEVTSLSPAPPHMYYLVQW